MAHGTDISRGLAAASRAGWGSVDIHEHQAEAEVGPNVA